MSEAKKQGVQTQTQRPPSPFFNMTKKTKHSRLRQLLKWGFIITLITVVTLIGYTWWAIESDPSYWRDYDPQSTVLEEAGVDLEQKVPSQLHQIRKPGESWQMVLTQDQINAWVATRLPKWLANQREELKKRKLPSRIPEEVKQIMVALDENLIAVAAKVEVEPGNEKVFSLEFEPFIGPNDLVRLELKSIKGGRLWLPEGLVEMALQKFGSQEKAEKQIIKKAKSTLKQFDLTYQLPDHHRKVEVLKIIPGKEQITLTLRTVMIKK